MTDNTLDNIRKHLATLRLKRMDQALDEQLAVAHKQNRSTAQVLERLLEIEAVSLIERRIERRIKQSKLPERKLLADCDGPHPLDSFLMGLSSESVRLFLLL